MEGFWWLPQEVGHRMPGTLTYIPGEYPDLKTWEVLDNPNSFLSKHFNSDNETPAPSIIHGEDVNGKRVTLLLRDFGKKNWNLSCTFSVIHYGVRYILSGIHLEHAKAKLFNEIEIELTTLTSWLNRYPVRNEFPIKDGKLTADFSLSYMKGHDQIFEIGEGYQLSFMTRAVHTSHRAEEITITQKYIAQIRTTQKASLEDLIEKCNRFLYFIDMATFSRNHFLAMRIYDDDYFEVQNDQAHIPQAIDLFIRQVELPSTKPKIDFATFLFNYQQIKVEFPEMIKKWFAFDSQMMPMLIRLVDSIHEKSIFKSADFLNVAQAIEGYYIRFKKDVRLKAVIEGLVQLFSPEVKAIQEINVDLVVNSRNYYSHLFAKKNNRKVADGAELFFLTKKLRYLLICCFLHELGLKNAKINELVEGYREFNDRSLS